MAAVPLAWALHRPVRAVAERWCERQAVPVTSESVELARHDLRRIRSLRTAGAVVGELTRRSARARSGRGARLETRRSSAYTAPPARWLPGGGTAVAAVAVGVSGLRRDAPADAPATGQLAMTMVIAAMISAGTLPPGRQLPPTRQLGVDPADAAAAVTERFAELPPR